MPEIKPEKVRELYASAVAYDEQHARHDLNAAEFDEWLEAHDRALRVALLTDVAEGMSKVVTGNDAIRAQPAFDLIAEKLAALQPNTSDAS